MHRRIAALLGVVAVVAAASGCTYLQRVDQPTPAAQTQGAGAPELSGDGQYVTFAANADNVVPFDDNGATDVFRKDRSTGIVALASRCANCGPVPSGQSNNPAMSRDGRFVVFESEASDMVPGDTNGTLDIFLRDFGVDAGAERVNLGAAGAQANAFSTGATVSSDGRYVVFASDASNLVAGDTNGVRDIFRRDRQTGTTTRLSVTTAGVQANNGSYLAATDGSARFTVFKSTATNLVAGDTNGFDDLFLRDAQTNTTTRVNLSTAGVQADGFTGDPVISRDGSTVAFTSGATNLVGTDTNFEFDVFVRTLATNTTTRVSVGTGGAQGGGTSELPDLSDDGSRVAFVSSSTNLVAGDTNGVSDAFVRNRTSGTTTRESVADNEAQQTDGIEVFDRIAISGDGSQVAFPTTSSNLVAGDTNGSSDIFLRSRSAGTTIRVNEVSEPVWNDQNSLFFQPSGDLSANGRYVTFSSPASNLVPGDTNGQIDVFVRDLTTNTVERVSVSSSETQATGGYSDEPRISGDGRWVIYTSGATNLVAGDTNGLRDIFMRDRINGGTFRVNVTTSGGQALGGDSGSPDLADAGTRIVFTSEATNLVAGDTNGFADVFLRDGPAGVTLRMSVSSAGAQADAASFGPRINSSNGDIVSFSSFATNLAAGTDPSPFINAFVRVRSTAVTQRIDQNFGGVDAANGQNIAGAMSADGRYVGFTSGATDVLPGDTVGGNEAYLRDRVTGVAERINVPTGGGGPATDGAGPVPSADARFVLFSSESALVAGDTNFEFDAYLRDRLLNRTTRVGTTQFLGEAEYGAGARAMSDDARYALLGSQSALVAGDSDYPFVTATLYVRGTPQPTITSASPTSVPRNTTRTVTVNGTYFLPGVTGVFGTGITVTATNLVNEGQVQFTIQIAANAPTGARTVVVGNFGTGAGAASSAGAAFTLTVT